MSDATLTAVESLHARIVAAAKRWYTALSVEERAGASVALTRAVQALLKAEGKHAN